MRISKRNTKWLFEGYEHLIDLANEFFKMHWGNEPDEMHLLEINGKYIQCKGIIKGWRAYEQDSEYWIEIPIEYLWTVNWQQVERDKIWNDNMKAIDARRIKEAEIANFQEQKDREQYLILKERFKDE